jgi:hypothetical protein
MYLVTIVLLMLVFPATFIGVEHFYLHSAAPLILLLGKWFVFWGVGVRLLLAGLRQLFQPRFTAEEVLGIRGAEALLLVQELGAANLATGLVGIASVARPGFVLPVAIIAAVFYGIAGIRDAMADGRTGNQNVAMVSDLFMSLILAVYIAFV